jgi:GTPase SAR1 family protein
MNAYALKFIMLGDSRVGKSQLSRAFTSKPFLVSLKNFVLFLFF